MLGQTISLNIYIFYVQSDIDVNVHVGIKFVVIHVVNGIKNFMTKNKILGLRWCRKYMCTILEKTYELRCMYVDDSAS